MVLLFCYCGVDVLSCCVVVVVVCDFVVGVLLWRCFVVFVLVVLL